MNNSINILNIIRGTTVDGPGFRTSIYIAGCRHACPGCHNPSSWDFNAGSPYSIDEIMEIIEEEDFDVTLSGGDPLYHPEFVKEIIGKVNSLGHNVWIYTGFRWEEIISTPLLLDAIREADVIVDSPFILALRDTDLLFRGSSNQRIIDVQKSISGDIVLWERE
ncbi:MAG: anaerobic ribonucleoside-triphosphate reductase activating protein [Muribaculaceae bacterium]|nr:anaerobic ribonucleoside-triphosphate reductase activating protein [Muribaculaceae bacterium]